MRAARPLLENTVSSRKHSYRRVLVSENMVEGMPCDYYGGIEILTIL
jgi:hypothetical protein